MYVKASILSGESVFLQDKGQRGVDFIAASCNSCRARSRVRGSQVKYSTAGSVSARNLCGTIKTEVLEWEGGPRVL